MWRPRGAAEPRARTYFTPLDPRTDIPSTRQSLVNLRSSGRGYHAVPLDARRTRSAEQTRLRGWRRVRRRRNDGWLVARVTVLPSIGATPTQAVEQGGCRRHATEPLSLNQGPRPICGPDLRRSQRLALYATGAHLPTRIYPSWSPWQIGAAESPTCFYSRRSSNFRAFFILDILSTGCRFLGFAARLSVNHIRLFGRTFWTARTTHTHRRYHRALPALSLLYSAATACLSAALPAHAARRALHLSLCQHAITFSPLLPACSRRVRACPARLPPLTCHCHRPHTAALPYLRRRRHTITYSAYYPPAPSLFATLPPHHAAGALACRTAALAVTSPPPLLPATSAIAHTFSRRLGVTRTAGLPAIQHTASPPRRCLH